MILIPGISERYSTQIVALFRDLPAQSKAILFGSRAKGNYREGSDIDVAIQGDQLTLDHRDQILLKYEKLNLPWKLDIVLYSIITEPALREHIDRVGREI